ncbi:hypothetical protein E3Q19_01510 [Wallemia mellicola]|nr:hypothetical protein E3Q19_01510 [Wallemia mellicola]
MLCLIMWAATAGFQAKWDVGPSGLSGLSIAASLLLFILSVILFTIPMLYIKKNMAKLTNDQNADLFLRERRSAWVLNGIGVFISLLMAAISTGSAFTTAGCKNPDDDPNEGKGDNFKDALPIFCGTKKTASILFWVVFFSWMGSIAEIMLNNKNLIKKSGRKSGTRDPPFQAPDADQEAGYGYAKETYQSDASNRTYDDSSAPLTGRTVNPFEPEPGNPYDRVSDNDDDNNPFSHPAISEPEFVYKPGMYSSSADAYHK